MPLTSTKNPADIVNVALMRIGYKGGDIGSLYEGSIAANVALDCYGACRDALLRSDSWDFAQRSAYLQLQRQAPAGGYVPGVTPWSTAYPPIPWLFEYLYPNDAIKIRAVRPIPIFIPNFDPQPHIFSIANDPVLVPPQEVILCNVENAMAIYTARVTDPTQFPADFTDAFIDSLALSIAPGLANLDTAKVAAAEEGAAAGAAKMEHG